MKKIPYIIPYQELRELTKLNKEGYDASFHVSQDELSMGMTESSIQELNAASGRPKKRIDALLQEAASTDKSIDSKFIECFNYNCFSKWFSSRFFLCCLQRQQN